MTEQTQTGTDPTDTLVEGWAAVHSLARRVVPPQPKPSDSITLQPEGTTILRNAGHRPPDDVNAQRHSCDNIKFREQRLKPEYSSLQT
jgi:hypothetical protein